MNSKVLNVKYALVNVGFMALVAGSIGFAYNYLSQSGFSAGTIGTTMSLVSLLGVFLGPWAGSLVDRSEKITQKTFILASMVVIGVGGAVLFLLPEGSFVILPVVVVAFAACMVGMPLLNGMAFAYEKAGGVINYGLGRGIGSAAYAVAASVLGQLWAQLGRNTLPVWIVGGAILTAVRTLAMPDPPKVASPADDKADKGTQTSALQFFVKYRRLLIVAAALVLIYFCHNVFNTYLGAVLGDIMSGSSPEEVAAVQGNALFIQAMVELPTMFGFALIMRRMSINQIMAVAAIFFSIKHAVLLFANSVPMFYVGMVLQMFSFAAITPALAYFANEQVDEQDANKSQGVFMTTNTVGSLLASFVGGWMFELLSVRSGLTVAVVASCVGTALMVVGTLRLGWGRKKA